MERLIFGGLMSLVSLVEGRNQLIWKLSLKPLILKKQSFRFPVVKTLLCFYQIKAMCIHVETTQQDNLDLVTHFHNQVLRKSLIFQTRSINCLHTAMLQLFQYEVNFSFGARQSLESILLHFKQNQQDLLMLVLVITSEYVLIQKENSGSMETDQKGSQEGKSKTGFNFSLHFKKRKF